MKNLSKKNSYKFFLQSYFLIFSTELMFALLNPSYVQLFFDDSSPFFTILQNNSSKSFYYGLFMTGGQIASLFANLILGFLSDKIGRKPFIILSILSIVIASLSGILGAKHELIMLFIWGYILGQLLYSMFPIIIASVTTAAYNEKNKLILIGFLQFFTGLAFIIGPLLGSLIIDIFKNFIFSYYITLIFSCFLLFGISIFYFPKESLSMNEKGFVKHYSVKNTILMLKNSRILILTVLLILDQIAWGTFFQFIQPFVKLKLAFSVKQIGYLVSFIGFSLTLSSLILLPILQRYIKQKNIFYISLIFMIIGILGILSIFFLPENSSCKSFILYLMTFFIASGDVIIFSLLVVSFSDMIPVSYQGMISGFLYTLSKGFGWSISAFLGSFFMNLDIILVMVFPLLILIVCFIFFAKFSNQIYY